MVEVLFADKIPVQLVNLCVDVATAFVVGDGVVIHLYDLFKAVIQKHDDHDCPGVPTVEDRHGIGGGDVVFRVAHFCTCAGHHGAVHVKRIPTDVVAETLGVSALAGAG